MLRLLLKYDLPPFGFVILRVFALATILGIGIAGLGIASA